MRDYLAKIMGVAALVIGFSVGAASAAPVASHEPDPIVQLVQYYGPGYGRYYGPPPRYYGPPPRYYARPRYYAPPGYYRPGPRYYGRPYGRPY